RISTKNTKNAGCWANRDTQATTSRINNGTYPIKAGKQLFYVMLNLFQHLSQTQEDPETSSG
ncbi:MAG TPA: hypothetical protein VF189_06550, partial [Patescibacteria group bacterium]